MAGQSWKLHGPISNGKDQELSDSCENPLDWTCEDLKGRATGIFLPLDKSEVLVKEGDVVDIREQTLDGVYFVIHNQRTGESGNVPVEYIDIIPEDVDQLPLPVKVPEPSPKPGQGLSRKLGVSRRRGPEIRQRMEVKQRRSTPQATLSTQDTATHPLEENGDSHREPPARPATFPRFAQRITVTSPTTAQSLAVASVTVERDPLSTTKVNTKDRANTALPPDNTGDKRREIRSATVDMPTAMENDDITEYEDGFRIVEQHNIVSVSGSDRDGRPVIVFSACRLPPAYAINHDVLLRYLKYTLDKYVEQDYTVVYCHHGFSSRNKPRFAWLRQVYRELDRKYKKNIKKLYIVHPTNFIRIIMGLMKPIINYKFGKKVSYINRLAELEPVLYLDQVDIPDEVKRYDLTLTASVRQVTSTDSRSVFHTPLLGEGELAAGVVASRRQFGVPLQYVTMGEDNIPRVLRTCVQLIEKRGMNVEGIFRRSPATATIRAWKEQFNEGHEVDLDSHGDPHLAAVLIKLFLRELPEPLLTFNLYKPIMELKTVPSEERIAVVRDVIHKLPPVNLAVLHYLITFMSRVAQNHEVNKMTSFNVAIVLGPNLVWSTNAIANLAALGEINSFTLLLINNCSDIFKQTH